jgi:hypothetical protein
MPKKSDTEEIPDLPAGKQEAVLRSLPESVPDLGPVVAVEQQEASLLQDPGTLFLLAGTGVVIVAILWFTYPTLRADDKTPVFVFGIVVTVLAVLCTVLAVAVSALPFYSRGTHWVFCRDGLVRVRWGRWADVFPWSDLEVRKVSSSPVVREYEVAAPGREPVRLTYGLFGGKLIRKIQDLQVRSVLPALRDAVAAGEELPFGPVWVSREGLHHRKKVLPWAEVVKLEFAANFKDGWAVTLTVRSIPDAGVWASVTVTDNMPNAWLFYQLVTALEPGLATDANKTANLRSWLA